MESAARRLAQQRQTADAYRCRRPWHAHHQGDGHPGSRAKGLTVSKADGFTYFVTYRNGTGLSAGKPVGLIIEQAALSNPNSSQFWGFIKDIWQEPRVRIWFENKGMTATEATIGVTYAPPALPGHTICTWQDSRCVLPAGVSRVAFGNLTGFVYRDNLSGSFQCNQYFFQQWDPVPNVVKGGFYKSGAIGKVPNAVTQ